MNDEQPIDPQLVAALRAFSTASMNGVIGIASGLRGRGLLSDGEIKSLHEQVSAPLVAPGVADNPVAQAMQDYLDLRFATILQGELPTG